MARRNLRKTRAILLAILAFVICGGAFFLITILAPISDDPEGISRLLGQIGGGAGAIGLIAVIWSFFVKNDPKV